jgi:hypothetical protein
MAVVKVSQNSSCLIYLFFFHLGTVSVDPNLDGQKHQLIIRHSMLKFTSDHDQLEICKVSSPRM